MKVNLPPGKYVIAVSGGVDSMVLLDMLTRQLPVTSRQSRDRGQTRDKRLETRNSSSLELVVAHFNHGIRPDASKDEELVKKTAGKLRLPFEVAYGQLGPRASEKRARTARYYFLEKVRQKYKADSIITAHHRDDLLETAMINLIRGTGWRGLASIQNQYKLLRPMLGFRKTEILSYARAHKLEWREDSSNDDTTYLRNYLRKEIIPSLSASQKKLFISNIDAVAKRRDIIDQETATLSQQLLTKNQIDRRLFGRLPVKFAQEVLTHILRKNHIDDLDNPTINRLVLAIRNGRGGSSHAIKHNWSLRLTNNSAIITRGHKGTV